MVSIPLRGNLAVCVAALVCGLAFVSGCSDDERVERMRQENLEREQRNLQARRALEQQRSEAERRRNGIEEWRRVQQENRQKMDAALIQLRNSRRNIQMEFERKRKASEERQLLDSADQIRRLKIETERSNRLEDELRTFALKESPVLWQTLQDLRSKADVQNDALELLRQSFSERGVSPAGDCEYVRVLQTRNRLVRLTAAVEDKIEEAYLMACKFRATPTKVEFEQACRKALKDGVEEAERARRFYQSLEGDK